MERHLECAKRSPMSCLVADCPTARFGNLRSVVSSGARRHCPGDDRRRLRRRDSPRVGTQIDFFSPSVDGVNSHYAWHKTQVNSEPAVRMI